MRKYSWYFLFLFSPSSNQIHPWCKKSNSRKKFSQKWHFLLKKDDLPLKRSASCRCWCFFCQMLNSKNQQNFAEYFSFDGFWQKTKKSGFCGSYGGINDSYNDSDNGNNGNNGNVGSSNSSRDTEHSQSRLSYFNHLGFWHKTQLSDEWKVGRKTFETWRVNITELGKWFCC